MNEIIQNVKEYIGLGLGWLQSNLEANTEVFVVVVVIVSVILVYTFLKEMLDILTGSNKPALKNKLLDLNEANVYLNESIKTYKKELDSALDHSNSLTDELNTLKAVKFDEAFSSEEVKGFTNKDAIVISSLIDRFLDQLYDEEIKKRETSKN